MGGPKAHDKLRMGNLVRGAVGNRFSVGRGSANRLCGETVTFRPAASDGASVFMDSRAESPKLVRPEGRYGNNP
jgi:hypothetical protein